MYPQETYELSVQCAHFEANTALNAVQWQRYFVKLYKATWYATADHLTALIPVGGHWISLHCCPAGRSLWMFSEQSAAAECSSGRTSQPTVSVSVHMGQETSAECAVKTISPSAFTRFLHQNCTFLQSSNH